MPQKRKDKKVHSKVKKDLEVTRGILTAKVTKFLNGMGVMALRMDKWLTSLLFGKWNMTGHHQFLEKVFVPTLFNPCVVT